MEEIDLIHSLERISSKIPNRILKLEGYILKKNNHKEKLEIIIFKGFSSSTTHQIEMDLESQWEVLAEPVQTILRKYQVPDAYEQLKSLTRGKRLTQTDFQKFVTGLNIPEDEKQRLLKLKPSDYTGLASEIARV